MTSDLRAAWEAMHYRRCCAAWPQDFDQVMADPIAMRLVRLEAMLRTRSPATRQMQRTVPPPYPMTRPYGLTTDVKRAAAGDRDD